MKKVSLSLSLYTHVCIICCCWIEEEWGKQFSQSHVLLALIYGDIDLQNARWKWNIRNNKSWCAGIPSLTPAGLLHLLLLFIRDNWELVWLLHNAATVNIILLALMKCLALAIIIPFFFKKSNEELSIGPLILHMMFITMSRFLSFLSDYGRSHSHLWVPPTHQVNSAQYSTSFLSAMRLYI